jgi:polygalacturonase/uncharacterized protein YjdB
MVKKKVLSFLLMIVLVFMSLLQPICDGSGRVAAEETIPPIPADGKYEAESHQSITDSYATGVTEPFFFQSPFSRFDATAIGDYAVYKINVAEEGDYKLTIRYRRHQSTGNSDFYINGVKHTKGFDNRVGSSYNSYYMYEMGVVHLMTGMNSLKFVITEMGSSGYKLNIDYFQLVKEEPVTIPDIEFGEAVTQGNITVYPITFIYTESASFGVKVNNLKVPVINCNSDYDYANFSMADGDATIEITTSGSLPSYTITPRKLGLQGTVVGNKLTFTIHKDEYLIISIPGYKRLVITADPAETDIPASSGTGIFNVLDAPYNADRTNTFLTKAAIQKAIDDASAYGSVPGNPNGIVYIPVGVYKTSNLILKSHVDIYLQGGAVLYASTKLEDYIVHARKDSLAKDITHMINTENKTSGGLPMESTDMKIYGRGTIDANGSKVEAEARLLVKTLVPQNCSYFVCDGITLKESNIWSVVPAWSDHLTFTNLKFMNKLSGAHENDCIDIVGSQEVLVQNCIGIALDDPFSTKTWLTSVDIGRTWNAPAEHVENVLFEDNISWTWCYGFKVGQGSLYDHINVTFRNGTVLDCAVGLGIHHKYGAGLLKDITFEDIDIENITCQNDDNRTWFMAQVNTGADGSGPIDNVTVRNINIYDRGVTRGKILGVNEEAKATNFTFENIRMLGNNMSASTLAQMNVTNRNFYENAYVLNGTPSEIPAVYYNNHNGITIERTSEIDDLLGGGSFIKGSNASWVAYDEVDFGSGVEEVDLRILPYHSSDSVIELHLGTIGNVIGTVDATGSGLEYVTRTAAVGKISGVHTLYLVFKRAGDSDPVAGVSWIDIRYNNAKIVQNGNIGVHSGIDFGTLGTDNLVLKSSSTAEGTVSVYLDNEAGTLIGTTVIENTDGNWIKRMIPLSGANGEHDLYFVTTGSITLDSFQYIKDNKANNQNIPTGISLDQSEVTIPLGGSTKLTEAFLPAETTYRDIRWNVVHGDTSVSVSDTGIVTALTEGDATVRVTSLTNPSVYADCIIHVVGAALEIVEIPMVTIETAAGAAPALPAKVSVKNSAGSYQLANIIEWEIIEASNYQQIGSFHVLGIVEGTELKADAFIQVVYAPLPDAVSSTFKLNSIDLSLYETSGAVIDTGGDYLYYGAAPGDWFKVRMEVPTSGIYNVKIKLKLHEKKGIFTLYANENEVGTCDQYYAGNKENQEVNLGNAIFATPGTQELKFLITGKNANSGGYQMVINSITLTPVLTGITTNESNVTVQVGASKQLDYSFSNVPEDAKGVSCTVISGGENVAVYHNGIITGLREGYASVRVQSNRYEGFYVDYSVSVLPAIPVSGSAIISPNLATFDKNITYQSDVNTSIIWNDAASLVDIQHMGISIGVGAYAVSGSALTMKKEYLATKAVGNQLFHILFDYGNMAELNILISDTTPEPSIPTPPPMPTPDPIPAPNPVPVQDSPTPTPTPIPTPIPTNTPIVDQIKVPGAAYSAQVSIMNDEQNNRLEAKITLPEDEITKLSEQSSSDEPMELKLSVSSEKLLESIKQENIKSINLEIVIPSSISNDDKIDISDISLDSAILNHARSVGKDVTITVISEKGKEQYSWTFTRENLASSDKSIADINLSLEVGMLSDDEKLNKLLGVNNSTTGKSSQGLLVNFNHHGELPVQAKVRIYVGDREGMKPGERIYLYYYNPSSNKLETLPYSSGYRMDSEGYISVDLLHFSDYVILPKGADKKIILPLIDQVTVKPDKTTLYTGKGKASKGAFKISLPNTLELVKSLTDKTYGSSVGAVTVTYRSSNPNVVKINKNGAISAQKKGTATIYATITLYSNKEKVIKYKITVKDQKVKK